MLNDSTASVPSTRAPCGTFDGIAITPPAVNEEQVAAHWGLARFGVRFRNENLARVAGIVRDFDGTVIDAFSNLGMPPRSDFLMGDGLHLTLAGQKQLALEVIKGWSTLK